MKNYSKKLIVHGFVAVLVLVLIGLGVYYAHKNSKQRGPDNLAQQLFDRDLPEARAEKMKSFSSTENWQTYTDESFGFRFKYHPGLAISTTKQEYSDGTIYYFSVNDIELSYPSYRQDEVIDMGILVKDETLENFIKERKSAGVRVLKQEPYTLGGVSATKLTLVGEIVGTNQETNYIFARYNGLSFMVMFAEQKETKINPKTVIDTFEFINGESATGLIKKTYSKNGKNYIDIDYITLRHEEGDMPWGTIVNDDTKIKILELSSSVKIKLVNDIINGVVTSGNYVKNFEEFKNILNSKNDFRKGNPWNISIKNGVVVEIEENFRS